MRTLHVVSSLNVGGAERFVIDLATQQKNALAMTVGVLSMGKDNEPLESEVLSSDIKLHLSTDVFKIGAILSDYDVVHIHSSYCLLRVLIATFFKPIKVVYTRHNETVHQGLKWRIIYFLANIRLNKMIFVAEKAKQNYLAKYPQYHKKALTILNGVLPINKNPIKSETFKLGHVGRFVPLKSQHVLIEAVSYLSAEVQPKVELSFYGTGELMAHNKDLAKKLIPNTHVNFHGFETNRDIIFQSFDALIVTSETEGLSLAILEAFASSTPVIASNVGGNPELVVDKNNGFLYEYADSKTLAKCIEELLINPELYQAFSKKSHQRYIKEFSMEICARNHLSSYE